MTQSQIDEAHVLSLEHEVPHKEPLPNLPNWSESYGFTSSDPAAGVGLWLHLGRWRRDTSLWRETLAISLPGGEVVVARAIGSALAAPDGPGACNYSIRLLEPGRRLRYQFNGAARRLPAGDLRNGLPRDSSMERLRFDLIFESDADIWDLHEDLPPQEFASASHIEQIGTVRGQIEIGGNVFDYRGMGTRDHSSGPRDLSTIHSHQWYQGYFSDGTSIQLFDAVVRGSASPIFSIGVIYRNGKISKGILTDVLRIDRLNDHDRPFEFAIKAGEDIFRVEVLEIKTTAYLSYTAPNDVYVGIFPAGPNPVALLQQTARLRLNGSVEGYGNLERTVPGTIATEGDAQPHGNRLA